jgi:rhodanese-related sulfurtransferase
MHPNTETADPTPSESVASTGSESPPSPAQADPGTVSRWVEEGRAVVIDVREPFEHAAERIRGARSVPLSKLEPDELAEEVAREHPGVTVVFHCASGKRSEQALAKLAQASVQVPCTHMAGGLEAWKASGRPVEKPAGGPPIPVMRQVQIAAGSLVLAGVVLGWLAHPGFYGVSAFVGAGLVFAGTTGWCGMAMLLARMPWNRAPASCDAV